VSVAAVILAAGGGTRFAGSTHKLRALLNGEPLLTHSLQAAIESGIGPVMVVTGAEDLTDLIPPSVSEVRIRDWTAGQSHSLAAAVEMLESTRSEALVVGLADMPGVTADCWRAVSSSAAPIAVATFDGHRRPPVRLAREVWGDLPTEGDQGARVLMRQRPDLVVEVPVRGDPRDVDTVGDLRGL
jgi:molybdenum cofactor cytidylyltransferase